MSYTLPTIQTLHDERTYRDSSTVWVFDGVLSECGKQIRSANKNSNATSILFDIPRIIIGITDYNPTHCALYVVEKLILVGYNVQYLDNGKIRIDWSTDFNKKVFNKEKVHVILDNNVKVKDDEKFKSKLNELLARYPDATEIEVVRK